MRRDRWHLHCNGRPLGRLEWRQRPRDQAGWYVVCGHYVPRRLDVDPAVDELAADRTSTPEVWALNAELARTLSFSLALDAADRLLNPGRRPVVTGREGAHVLYLVGVSADLLGQAVPEMRIEPLRGSLTLVGHIAGAALERAVRRICLLGGRVVGILRVPGEGASLVG